MQLAFWKFLNSRKSTLIAYKVHTVRKFMLILLNKAASNSDYTASNDWIMNNNLERMWKEGGVLELA
jgi:hypothetical protein